MNVCCYQAYIREEVKKECRVGYDFELTYKEKNSLIVEKIKYAKKEQPSSFY